MKLLNIFTNILVLSSMAVSVACNETEERGSEARTINAVIRHKDIIEWSGCERSLQDGLVIRRSDNGLFRRFSM